MTITFRKKTDVARSMMLAVGLALMTFVAGCDRTKISDINNDPGRYANQDVTIAGEVTSSFGALNQGAFEVNDGTGRLWVYSNGFGVPAQGVRVSVTGRIQSGLTVGGRSFANILRETRAREGD